MILKIVWTCFLITTLISTVFEYRKDWTIFRSWFDSFVSALANNLLVYLLIIISAYIYLIF